MERIETDICVIGAGAGGLSVAAGAAMLGARVVLVEKGEMGGDCLNTGCVPSKSLVHAARVAETMRRGRLLGMDAGPVTLDYGAVHRHIHDVIAQIAPQDSVERFEGLGVTVIKAHAHFTGPRSLRAGEAEICARRFVIATGARPVIPDIPGLADLPYLTSETIFDLTELPRHLLILGGGPVAFELAQAYRRLGAAVTMVALAFLPREDREAAELLLARLRAEGVETITGTIREMTQSGQDIRLLTDSGTSLSGSHLLLAAGRAPDLDGLGLDAAGVVHDATGIRTDRRLRTSNRRIHAVGDVTGRAQFTHVAGHHAGIVIRNALFRLPARIQDHPPPSVVYTDPELAQVGLTEDAARAAGHAPEVIRLPYAECDRARTDGVTEGFIKLVMGRRGRVLGVTIVGAQAGELVHPWALVVSGNLKLAALASYIAPYPTLGEISKRAAGQYFAPRVFGPLTRKLVSLLARFG